MGQSMGVTATGLLLLHPHPKPLLDGRCGCGVRPVLHCPFWLAVDARIRHDAGRRLTNGITRGSTIA